MADISHAMGEDLAAGPTGDLKLATGTQYGQQRVLRRLLTNPGDEIWLPSYGAGLPGMVGMPADAARIRAIARGQMLREQAVASVPVPEVAIGVQADGAVTAAIRYADAATGDPVTLAFPVA